MDIIDTAILDDLSAQLTQTPDLLAQVHQDIWITQLPRVAISAAHSDSKDALQAVSVLVRRLNLLLQSKSGFSQNLGIFLIGRISSALNDTPFSSNLVSWFQSTLSFFLRSKDDAPLANALTTLDELVQLGKSNPELRKSMQSNLARLLVMVHKNISDPKTAKLEYATLLGSIAANQPQAVLAKREELSYCLLKLLLHSKTLPESALFKTACTGMRALYFTSDRRQFSHVEFSVVFSKLLATLSGILTRLFPTPILSGDAIETEPESYLDLLGLKATQYELKLGAYPLLMAFEKVSSVIRRLLSGYEPARMFELNLEVLISVIDKAYDTIEQSQVVSSLKTSTGSQYLLAKSSNKLLLVGLSLCRSVENPKKIQELCRKALVSSHGEARISAYQTVKHALMLGILSDSDTQLLSQTISQDIKCWQLNMMEGSDQSSKKRKVGSQDLGMQCTNINIEIQAQVVLAGLKAIAISGSLMNHNGLLIASLSSWISHGVLDQVHESQERTFLEVQVQLIATLSAIVSGCRSSIIPEHLSLISKLAARCLHHPEYKIRQASIAMMNAFSRSIHPTLPPIATRTALSTSLDSTDDRYAAPGLLSRLLNTNTVNEDQPFTTDRHVSLTAPIQASVTASAISSKTDINGMTADSISQNAFLKTDQMAWKASSASASTSITSFPLCPTQKVTANPTEAHVEDTDASRVPAISALPLKQQGLTSFSREMAQQQAPLQASIAPLSPAVLCSDDNMDHHLQDGHDDDNDDDDDEDEDSFPSINIDVDEEDDDEEDE
ncbi:hypothetical protein BASA61_006040 [Batrachochytrium salamandrivorans]|nr:hypothetical protein BASA61_006040 [Batrachochytrium salamandrivorans]KAH9247497.1 hypothetical protein BASA81_014915 [Batrachochytrium salamandrivorans]